jgi:tRNA (adenine22-N1)-methyltransferase
LRQRSPAFLAKWQRLLRLKQRTLTHIARARQAIPEEQVQELTQQVRWISELLAQET